MILSHRYKFIFIKPTKVAGTSVEANLAKYCGPQDIITEINEYSKDSDESKYANIEQNDKGFRNHITPKEIRKKIPQKIWNNYYKFTIIRNPWDMAISKYFWVKWRRKKHSEKKSNKIITTKKILKNIFNYRAYFIIFNKIINKNFEENIYCFLNNFRKEWSNEKFYFDKKRNPVCDFYIRYENLEEDYKKVCEHLGIPYEQLPRLKTKQRTEKKYYSTYYDKKTQKRIAKICQKEIKYFGYQFEEKNN